MTVPLSPDHLTVIEGHPKDLGAFEVRRLLPAVERRSVGPFVFFDHFGPVDLPPGAGMDVRPHPHIGLATVTYLWAGEIHHRDSVGSSQVIHPGDINWMTAGRGIVHSERSTPEGRRRGGGLHGLQLWVALPEAHEEAEPAFHHHPAASLPTSTLGGAHVRVLAGEVYGLRSPVQTHSPLFYVDAELQAGAELALPEGPTERAVYVAEGAVYVGATRLGVGQLGVFPAGGAPTLRAAGESRVALLGGEPVGRRLLWWNFVASTPERLERAKADWAAGRFPPVPGEDEFIPLPG